MKEYWTHQDNQKLYQLKVKSHEEIESLYYTTFRKGQHFIPMGSEEQNTRYLRSKSSKKQKTVPEDPLEEMMVIVPETLYIDPIQVKHSIIDWEIYTDKFGKAWKILRIGGISAVYKNFVDLVRALDR